MSKFYSQLEHRLFGLFLLVLSLRVLKSLFYSFSTEEPIWFLQSGPSFFLLIGPLLFCYVLSTINPDSFLVKHWKKHILLWCILVLFSMTFLPFKDHNDLYKTTLLPIVNIQWLIFIAISGIFIKSKYINTQKMKWLSFLLIAVFILWGLFAFTSFDYFVGGSILFSILFYSFFLFFIFHKQKTSEIFKKTKLKNIRIPSPESRSTIEKLHTTMEGEKLFLNPDLKLSEVSSKINIPAHDLSRLINENFDKNFTDFINEYRIEEAKKLLNENSLYTIEAIGNQCGFNSKSAFYKAFKKFTNTTPAKFKSQQ